jgi:AcrR family transcriptional regulator
MPRPSRHLDRALLAAGRELLPVHGCANLTVRQVAEAAGVNVGMFHYHFRTREIYLRAVMQGAYEEMFAQLALGIASDGTATANLRAAFRVLGRFLLANRALMARILVDALGGVAVARDFLRENFPRHVRVVFGLIKAGRAAGELRPLAPAQMLAFCAGSLAMPIVFGGTLADSGEIDLALVKSLRADVLSEKALDERIDLALAALACDAAPPRRKGGSR